MAWAGGESLSLCPLANSLRWWGLIAQQLCSCQTQDWESTRDWHQGGGIWRELCQWEWGCCLHLAATCSLQVPGNFPSHPSELEARKMDWLNVQKGWKEGQPTNSTSHCVSLLGLKLVSLLSAAGAHINPGVRFQILYCLGSEIFTGGR
jgi:hypothetical protein